MSTASLRLPHRFDYSFHRKFSESYQPLLDSKEVQELILGFSDVTDLDSAALGMMVLVHNKFSAEGKAIKIKGARGATLGILNMANMQKIFAFI